MTWLKRIALRLGMWSMLIACAGTAMLTWQFTRLYYLAEINQTKLAQAEQATTAREDDLRRLTDAQQRGDALTARLQERDAQLAQSTKEKTDALRRLTSGRACLGAAAVRVLNAATGGTAHLPEATTGAAATGATSAADSDQPGATDTDVAGWIGNAQQQHELCRARLDALIDFHQQEKTN